MYQKIDGIESEEDKNGPSDMNGYHGEPLLRSNTTKLKECDEKELVGMFSQDINRFNKVFGLIRTIDREHNGFVTITELEDIVKIVYQQELSDKDVVTYLKKYRSIQNKILVDYKHFKASILKQVNHQALTTIDLL
jgi:Ca2+-binding EF-hand superfamily protein